MVVEAAEERVDPCQRDLVVELKLHSAMVAVPVEMICRKQVCPN
jgi:hypothetical protein